MANKPKFIPPMEATIEVLPKWMVNGQKRAEKKARERIQYLTAIAQVAIANK